MKPNRLEDMANAVGPTTVPPSHSPIILVMSDLLAVKQVCEAESLQDAYQIVFVDDLAAAQNVLRHTSADVVVLDWGMVEVSDGVSAIREMHYQQPDARLIVLDGNGSQMPADLEVGELVFSHLRHPADAGALRGLIEAAVRSRHETIQYNQQLAKLEIENQRLKETSQRLQDALAFTGHEWRSQLSLLSLATDKLMRETKDVLNAKQAAAIGRMCQSASAMQRIARNYLDLTRLDQPGFAIRPTLINPVQDLIDPLLTGYDDLLSEKQQTYQIKTDQESPLVRGDRELLMGVYDNLISNAIRYGETGGKIVFTIADRGKDDELSVWNSGEGIPPEYLERVLERFTDCAEGPVAKHVGVGLYLARRIIEAHGGRMWVDTQPGAWAQFIFTLPKREPLPGVNGS